ncbi:hypothetical protein FN846DRAFT_794804 [Sphaerosporella brunnea]|uniref:Uncharacterized protein n=1 Tax=Sphaerosporella brunnea TaxID=1250544 RepID=A0A5J5EZP5_9PEZI|nr:hypothetical protein FN846DRAFT_794804 [Sphaerosporella brunnea]
MPAPPLRAQVKALYKDLLFLGRDYPLGYAYFRTRLHRAFAAQSHLRDEPAIHACISRGEFVKREIEALYYLKKYRALRERYGAPASAEVEAMRRIEREEEEEEGR